MRVALTLRVVLLAGAGWLSGPWVHAQETFTVKRDVELREAPQPNAKSTRLAANAA